MWTDPGGEKQSGRKGSAWDDEEDGSCPVGARTIREKWCPRSQEKGTEVAGAAQGRQVDRPRKEPRQ